MSIFARPVVFAYGDGLHTTASDGWCAITITNIHEETLDTENNVVELCVIRRRCQQCYNVTAGIMILPAKHSYCNI